MGNDDGRPLGSFAVPIPSNVTVRAEGGISFSPAHYRANPMRELTRIGVLAFNGELRLSKMELF